MSGFWKVCSFLCTQYLVELLHQCGAAWRRSVCGTAQVSWSPGCSDSGLQVICIVGSGVSHLDSLGFRSGEFAGQSSTVTHGHWTSFWYLWQCGQVPSPAGKWNKDLHKACQQKEAWSALICPGRCLCWLWTSENTVDQHQQTSRQPKSSLTGNFTLDFNQHGFCVSPLFLQTLGPWFTNEMQH